MIKIFTTMTFFNQKVQEVGADKDVQIIWKLSFEYINSTFSIYQITEQQYLFSFPWLLDN